MTGISHKYKFVFIHVPKTAGTSILSVGENREGALSHLFKKKRSITGKEKSKSRLGQNIKGEYLKTRDGILLGGHLPMFFLLENVELDFNKYFKFCFVRNPWDRFISAFYMNKKGKGHRAARDIPAFVDLNKFLCWVEKRENKIRTHGAAGIDHLLQQRIWATNRNGKFVVDKIYRYEQLESSLANICAQLDVKYHKVPHYRKSNHPSYRECLTKEQADRISKLYKEDIDLFKYSY